ncbi:MAG: hypothetical protein ACYC5G_00740 [Candidatus Doudnabacteria bacterium]
MNLHKIEKRIIEIKQEIANKPKELRQPIPQEILDGQVRVAIKPLTEELEQLQLQRQFILDRRDNLFWKTIWNIIVPIVVSLITTYGAIKFGLFR